MTTFADVYAAVSNVIAAHAQAQDDGRSADMTALYWPDGVLVVPGQGTYEGAAAINATWEAWKPTLPQRHISTSVFVTEWTETTAKATTDVIMAQKGDSGWTLLMAARYHDEFRATEDGTWLLTRREDEFIGF